MKRKLCICVVGNLLFSQLLAVVISSSVISEEECLDHFCCVPLHLEITNLTKTVTVSIHGEFVLDEVVRVQSVVSYNTYK